MRDYLFKGIATIGDTEKFVEGYFMKNGNVPSIIDIENSNKIYPVKGATVRQYIWLNDKEGKRVYIGDIINIADVDVCEIKLYRGVIYAQSKRDPKITYTWAELGGFSPEKYTFILIGNTIENPEYA